MSKESSTGQFRGPDTRTRAVRRGEQAPFHKLTDAQVIAMRRLYRRGRMRQRDLAEHYGVSLVTVNQIITRRAWKHLPEEASADPSLCDGAELIEFALTHARQLMVALTALAGRECGKARG